MEAYTKLFIMVALVLTATVGSGPTIANATGDRAICNMSREGFESCRPSVSGTNPVPPSLGCCAALADADLQCLCLFKNAKTFMQAYGVDPNLAIQLPLRCNLVSSFHC